MAQSGKDFHIGLGNALCWYTGHSCSRTMSIPRLCIHCNQEVLQPCRDEESLFNDDVLYVTGFWNLRRMVYFRRLKRATWRRLRRARRGKGIPQRLVAGWASLTIAEYGGRILEEDGSPFCTPEGYINEHLHAEDSARRIADIKAVPYREPFQRPQWKTLPRWQLLDLVLRIEARIGCRWYA